MAASTAKSSMGPTGRWNSIAADADRTVVSAYEETLGDLVLIDVRARWHPDRSDRRWNTG